MWDISLISKKRNIAICAICAALIIFLIVNWSKMGLKSSYLSSNWSEITPQYNSSPFLLEYSDTAKEANVKVIIWLENNYPIEELRKLLPSKTWNWEESVKYTSGGQKVTSLVGQTKVDRIKELELKKWYFDLVGRINSAGGQVYLDERIIGDLDITAFLSQNGAEPQQWMLEGNTLSVAARKSGLGEGIYAGKDLINLQLLTRSSNGRQQSVLAIPTLIEEF